MTKPTEPASSVAPSATERRAFYQLLLGAFVLKIVYLAQYVELPFLYGPLFDSPVYLMQAERVRSGRFGDPSLLAMSPLYGYWLAALHARAGSILPIALQLALGGLNLALVRTVARRLFGDPAGLAAAGMYLLYGPLLCLESKLMSETLGLSLLLLTLACTTAPGFLSGRLWLSSVAGCCMALAVLARASLLLTVPFMVMAVYLVPTPVRNEREPRWPIVRLRRTAGFVGAIAVVFTLYGGWTKVHSGLFVPVILTSSTAARASETTWTGDLSVFRRADEQDVSGFSVVRQASRRLARAARGERESDSDSIGMLSVLARAPHKLWLTLRDRETSFDYGFYGERTEAPALYACVVSFGTVLALGMLGLALVGKRGIVSALPLLAIVFGTLLTTVMFHPSTRYRLPLVVAMLPLAGASWAAAHRMKRGHHRLVVFGSCAAIALSFGVHQALRPLQRPGIWELRVAEASVAAGDFATARARADRARALDPEDPEVRARTDSLRARIGVSAAATRCRDCGVSH